MANPTPKDDFERALLLQQLKSLDKVLGPALAEEARQQAKSSFKSFFVQSWQYIEPGKPYMDNWHVDAMTNAMEALYKGDIQNLILEIPPRCSKSSIASVAMPAWAWLHDPTEKFITASCTAPLSTRDCVRARRLMQSDWYQSLNPPFEFTKDVNQKTYYENTLGGYRFATSVGGAIVGHGFSVAIIDDPLEPKKAGSKAYIDGVLDWYTQSLSTRRNSPDARMILMHQRLSENDPIGYELTNNGENWEVICLPMEYDSNHPQNKFFFLNHLDFKDPRTEEGQCLWPERFPPKELSRLKKILGPYGTAAQLQQNPVPIGGGIIKTDWIKYYGLPYNKFQASQYELMIGVWDLTFTDTGESYTVGQVWGKKGTEKHLIFQYRDKMDVVQQIQAIRKMKAEFPAIRAMLVEKKANGDAVLRMLHKEIPGLIAVDPRDIGKGDKEVRLAACSVDFEAGNVYFPDPSFAIWIKDLVEELTNFPRAKYDDQVDCISMALNWFASKSGLSSISMNTTMEEVRKQANEEFQMFGALSAGAGANASSTYRTRKITNNGKDSMISNKDFTESNSLTLKESRSIFN